MNRVVLCILALCFAACVRPQVRTVNDGYSARLSARNDALAGWSFVIDPGHGGPERGAPSAIAGNSAESDLNLAVSLMLGGLIEASGGKVTFTRTADLSVADSFTTLSKDLAARTDVANKARPDFFISVHHNSSADSRHQKIEVYYKLRTGNPSRELARHVLEELSALYPGTRSQLLAGNFSVLRNLKGEGVLVECSYLSDRALAPRLETIALAKKEAAAIYNGVIQYAAVAGPVIEFEPETGAIRVTVRDRVGLSAISMISACESDGPIEPRIMAATGRETAFTLPSPCFDDVLIEATNERGRFSMLQYRKPGRPSRADTLPVILVVADSSLAARIGREADGSPYHLIPMTADEDAVATLVAIEDFAPDFAIVIERTGKSAVTHYFRSSAGKKLAESIALRCGIPRVIAGSHYLLNHTSMPAVHITADRVPKGLGAALEDFLKK